MTKQEFDTKYGELVKRIPKLLTDRADKLWESGGIDPNAYEDSYVLPLILLTASLHEAIWRYEPLYKTYRQAVSNLIHF